MDAAGDPVSQAEIDALRRELERKYYPKNVVEVPEPGMPGAKAPGTQAGGPTGGSAAPTLDYSSYLGIFGLPGDVQAKINQIFASTPDLNQATQLSLAYLRGTDWYQVTYPGIQEGIAKGIVSNEAEYRGLLNQQTQLYKRYFGRDITSDEFASNMREGVSTDVVSRRLAGGAYAAAYGNDVQYTLGAFDTGRLNPNEMKAFGEQQAGLDSPLGIQIQRRFELAKQRLQGIFSGQLASPSLSLAGGRLSAQSLNPDQGDRPDIAA